MIGTNGGKATTVRRVAEEAGVSAPLILHHFGSKDGLVEACDADVVRRLDAATAALAESGSEAAMQQMLLIDGMADAAVYMARSIQDGGLLGQEWFDRAIEMTITTMSDLEGDGRVRTSDDPTMRAVLLLAMDMGVVFMRQMVERRLGAPITAPAVVNRWVTTEFELLTNGVFVAGEEEE